MTYDIANHHIKTYIFEDLDALDAEVTIFRKTSLERESINGTWVCRITIQNDNGEISTKAERATFNDALQAAYKNLGIAAVVDEG